MADVTPSRFALFFGNRGFFPAALQETARQEMRSVLEKAGHEVLMLPADATRHGAVETPAEGEAYAAFLAEHRGNYDGIVLCLPNFGDETGAVAALQDAGVPILIQAYPDELERMAPEKRRDAFCGKFSIMDVFCQYQLPFTALPPHVAAPTSTVFAEQLDTFDRLCRVVRGVRRMVVGAVGARTTAFKTVRIDELALQKHGITLETFDFSEVIAQVHDLSATAPAVVDKAARLLDYTNWDGVPEDARLTLAKVGVVLDRLVEDAGLDAVALRCWLEIQQQLKVSPCVLISEMNDRGVVTACEVDVGNAIMMAALRQATGDPATCLDWNNNYGDDPEKCILFHCGPVPQQLMVGPGQVCDHAILANAVGPGCSWGCNTGRIAPTPFTYGSLLTCDGAIRTYVGEGTFTADPIPEDFFGCAGVAAIPDLQGILQRIGYGGYRHHVSVSPGRVAPPLVEALTKYCGFEVTQ